MKKLKRFLKRLFNSIKFFNVNKDNYSKEILLDAKKSIYIEGGKNTSLKLKSPCFTSRKNVSFYIHDNGVLSIGKECFFNENCIIACREKISIGDNCLFGPNVCVYDHDHVINRKSIEKNKYKTCPVVIGNNVLIGGGTIILKGSCIGDNVVIGAGSVISGEIPTDSICIQKRQTMFLERK